MENKLPPTRDKIKILYENDDWWKLVYDNGVFILIYKGKNAKEEVFWSLSNYDYDLPILASGDYIDQAIYLQEISTPPEIFCFLIITNLGDFSIIKIKPLVDIEELLIGRVETPFIFIKHNDQVIVVHTENTDSSICLFKTISYISEPKIDVFSKKKFIGDRISDINTKYDKIKIHISYSGQTIYEWGTEIYTYDIEGLISGMYIKGKEPIIVSETQYEVQQRSKYFKKKHSVIEKEYGYLFLVERGLYQESFKLIRLPNNKFPKKKSDNNFDVIERSWIYCIDNNLIDPDLGYICFLYEDYTIVEAMKDKYGNLTSITSKKIEIFEDCFMDTYHDQIFISSDFLNML